MSKFGNTHPIEDEQALHRLRAISERMDAYDQTLEALAVARTRSHAQLWAVLRELLPDIDWEQRQFQFDAGEGLVRDIGPQARTSNLDRLLAQYAARLDDVDDELDATQKKLEDLMEKVRAAMAPPAEDGAAASAAPAPDPESEVE